MTTRHNPLIVLPESDLKELVRAEALKDRRSITSEVVTLIEEALTARGAINQQIEGER